MKRHLSGLLLLFVLILAGCGGGTGSGTVGDVSGIVQDINGGIVRDARVWIDGGPETRTNSSGAFTLTGVSGDTRLLKASATQDGLDYYGENVAQIFDGERSKSINITVVRANQRATLRGTVRDRDGFLVQGAKVFAVANENSSTMAITDVNGRFEMRTLLGSTNYSVVASALGYNSDRDIVNIPTGSSDDLDFTLANLTDPAMPAITDLEGTAWTSPRVETHTAQQLEGLDYVKTLLDPRRQARQTAGRYTTVGGNWVEVDLFWTPVVSTTNLLGYGIYRAQGDTNILDAVDFYRDPQAILYEDSDEFFTENMTLSYAITSLNTGFPDTPNGESDFSNRVVVHTLGDLDLNTPLFGPLTFRWFDALGATSYSVFLFDRYPRVDVDFIWSGTTPGNTSLVYSGPALQSGHTYYYVVLGLANGNTSRTISVIDSFVAP